ncbi:DUF2332 family protein [Bacillus sp. FJAT-47783]|uniref:DUF2332 family protein n=1 Tax=Bacillus sp. FJAT-47783 TaxID=2922712 RepID=UPI0024352F2B|nr:DUF2332 family protein [Bacillus sp. FJAT-47783]
MYIKDYSVQLIEGDGVTLLREIVENVPKDSSLCIFHTHVANQMPLEVKKLLLNNIESIGLERDVFHIYNKIQDRNLHLDYYLNGFAHKQTIAEVDGHGRWFKWLLQSELQVI